MIFSMIYLRKTTTTLNYMTTKFKADIKPTSKTLFNSETRSDNVTFTYNDRPKESKRPGAL